MKKILLASLLAAAQIATSLPAMAQTAAAGDANKPDDFAEIVVTAERRRTDLQKTPIAASVLTGEEVANAGVMTVDQLQFISPSATVNNFGQGIDFNIRGIGKAEHNSQTTTGVITYRDGVATFPGYYTAEPYYDLARVEILRGPQGTFVGENATGGAVFVSSQDPVINGGHTGYISAQAGNYSDLAAQGAIKIFAGQAREHSSFQVNAFILSNAASAAGLDSLDKLAGHSIAISLIGSPVHYAAAQVALKHHVALNDIRFLALQANGNIVSAVAGGTADTGVVPGTIMSPALAKCDL